MKKIVDFIKKNKFIFLSFIIPILIIILIFFMYELFTKYICARSDMQYQYISFLNYFKGIINGSESILYSFKKGLGGSMYGTFFYYMSSPLNLILLLFSKANLNLGIAILIILKLSLSGLTMFLYLKHKFKKESLLMLAFSSCYAISAYTIGYYFNIMWLDAVYLAPLLLIGIDKIVEKKDFKLYSLILFLDIFFNYYMAYMTCIFAVLYFIYELLLKYNLKENKKEIIDRVKIFITSSFLIGLCCCFIFLPVLNDLSKTAKINTLIYNNYNSNIIAFFTKFYIGTQRNADILNKNYINIYSSIVMFALVIFYFLNKKINFKAKLLSAIFILLMILPCFISCLNMIWHGFNFPICFNYRYSFLLILFIILISYSSYTKIKNINVKHYLITFVLFLLISIFMEISISSNSIMSMINIIMTVIYLSIYLMLLYNKNKIINLLICLLIFTELFMNFYLSTKDYWFIKKQQYYDYVIDLKEKLNDTIQDNYRFEKTIDISYNDSMLLNYNGVSIFNSLLNSNISEFLTDNGYYTEDTKTIYKTNNYITDSILGIKWILTNDMIENYKIKKKIIMYGGTPFYGITEDKYYLYENSTALSLGFMVNDNIKKFKNNKFSKLEYSSKLLNSIMGNNKDYFIKYNVLKDDNNYIIKNVKNVPFYYYIDLDYNLLEKEYLSLNFEKIKSLSISIYDNSIDYIYNNISGDINVTCDKKITTNKLYAGYYDYNLIKEDLIKLKENELNIIEKKDTYIKAIVDVSANKTLFTSIPYEKEWNVYVDGKKVDKFKLLDTFIGIDLKEGKHTVEFKYKDDTILIGSIISFNGLVLLVIYTMKRNIENE